MDVRQRRILAERELLRQLSEQSSLIEVVELNNVGDKYCVFYKCKGLVWLPNRPRPSVITKHAMEIYLHVNYPRMPPRLQWLTDIFHPNILPPSRNGGICIGNWTPAETLDQLVLRIGEMVQYKNYSTKDALNLEAAMWAEQNQAALPVDVTPLLGHAKPNAAIGVD